MRLNHIPADRTEITVDGKRYLALGDGRVYVWRESRWGNAWWVEVWGNARQDAIRGAIAATEMA